MSGANAFKLAAGDTFYIYTVYDSGGGANTYTVDYGTEEVSNLTISLLSSY
jgi:hypothetical protein